MREKRKLRRSGIKIMANLILLLGNLSAIMILAVVNGTAGFLCAMGVTLSGAAGIAKALGENIGLSYGALMALAVGCGILRGVLRYLEQYSNHYIAFRLLAVLRDKIFGALRVLCPAKLENKQKGSIIAMITSDIETLEVFYAHTISPVCIAVLVAVCVIVFVGFVSSWWLSLIAAAGYFAVGVLIPLWSSARMKASGVCYRSEFASFNSYFLDSIKGIKDIVLHNGGEQRKEEVNRRSETLLNETKRMKHDITRSSGATELLVSLFILSALAVGIILVTNNVLTIGKMLLGVSAIFGSFGPVIAISALPGNLTQTFASGDRVLNLISEKPAVMPVENGRNMDFLESLSVSHLSFSYDGATKVLSDICMKVKKGQIVGIVGASGCGKSTLLKLLLRFWQKDSGKIFYNNADIEEINTSNLLEHVTMVSQSTYLFDETIEENLRIAKPDATWEEIETACRQASIHDLIRSLPEGYHTQVGALGGNLSAGEKQRIGLVRAFLRGSELILLDEPTSNVDSINEGIILRALKEKKHEHGIILVSHRESTMAIADCVYQMEGGKFIEQNRRQKRTRETGSPVDDPVVLQKETRYQEQSLSGMPGTGRLCNS